MTEKKLIRTFNIWAGHIKELDILANIFSVNNSQIAENIINIYASKQKLIYDTIKLHSTSGKGSFVLPSSIKQFTASQKARKTVKIDQATHDELIWVAKNSGRKEADLFGFWISSALNTLISLIVANQQDNSGNITGFTVQFDDLIAAILSKETNGADSPSTAGTPVAPNALVDFLEQLRTGKLSDQEIQKTRETFKVLATNF